MTCEAPEGLFRFIVRLTVVDPHIQDQRSAKNSIKHPGREYKMVESKFFHTTMIDPERKA